MRGLLLLCLAAVATFAHAQWRPARRSATSCLYARRRGPAARRIGQHLAEALGVAIVVETNPGGGAPASAFVKSRVPRPMGPRYLVHHGGNDAVPRLSARRRSTSSRTSPGHQYARRHRAGARRDSPFSTVREMVDYTKRNTTAAAEHRLLRHRHHAAPRRRLPQARKPGSTWSTSLPGPAQANQDLYGGRIDMFFDGPATPQSGQPRKAARPEELVSRRPPKAHPRAARPRAPSHEAGLDFGVDGWIAFFRPGGVQPEVTRPRSAREIARRRHPGVPQDSPSTAACATGGMPPARTCRRRLRSDYERWGHVIPPKPA
jgi:tripartite-type tricarboxylate transporter receptor subunit TctC